MDRCLMYVQQYHIDEFLSVADRMKPFWYIVQKSRVVTTEDDAWNMVFNVWVLLLPDECRIIQSVEKSIYYSSNFLLFNELNKNNYFQQLKGRATGNEELAFIAACSLARCLAKWSLNDVMRKYNQTDIVERVSKRIYHDSHIATDSKLQLFLEDQARFTKAAVQELRTTNSFNERIKKCCKESYELYTTHFEKELNVK